MRLIKNLFSDTTTCSDLSMLSNLAFMESPAASLIIDENARIIEVNKAFSHLTGYSHEESIHKPISFLKSGRHDHQFYKNLWTHLLNNDQHTFEIYNKCKDGREILVREKLSAIEVNNKKYYISTQDDITEHTKVLMRERHLATHDPLTGLANRILLKDRFSNAIANATRYATKVVLIMCDLNDFKNVNDTHGHNFGDEVLKKVAKELGQSLRKGDTICRYGGDEFVILLEQISEHDEAQNLITKIKSKFPLSITREDKQCDINMSIGYSTFPEDGINYEQLSVVADNNMYIAKNEG